MHVYVTQANSPLSLAVKLTINEVSQKLIFQGSIVESNTHAQKNANAKTSVHKRALVVKFTRPEVIMHKGLLKLLIDHNLGHRNDVIKCSKLKWNHELQASGFTAKFLTFYDVISMVFKSVDRGKLWLIGFLQ